MFRWSASKENTARGWTTIPRAPVISLDGVQTGNHGGYEIKIQNKRREATRSLIPTGQFNPKIKQSITIWSGGSRSKLIWPPSKIATPPTLVNILSCILVTNRPRRPLVVVARNKRTLHRQFSLWVRATMLRVHQIVIRECYWNSGGIMKQECLKRCILIFDILNI